MQEYTSENPIFHNEISLVERADLVNNHNKNESAKQLLQNTLVLKKQLDACLGENGKDGKLDLADGIKADNLVGAVNEVFMLGSKIKKELAENLTAIGIASSAGEPIGQLLGKVLDAVDTSGDTVTGTVLLTGYTAHDSAGGQITGSMANNGAWTGNTTGPGNVAIPKGYHNGGGYVGGRGAYDKGVADADARTNPDSANYKSGYGAGVSSLNGTINDLNGQIASKNNTIDGLNGQLNNALEGFDTIYNAIVGQGTTPDGTNPTQIVNGINTMADKKYKEGIADCKTEAKIFTQATVFGYSTQCQKGDIIAMATYGEGLAWDITNVTTLHHGVFAYSTVTIYRVNADGTVKCTFTQGSDYKWYLVRLHD